MLALKILIDPSVWPSCDGINGEAILELTRMHIHHKTTKKHCNKIEAELKNILLNFLKDIWNFNHSLIDT